MNERADQHQPFGLFNTISKRDLILPDGAKCLIITGSWPHLIALNKSFNLKWNDQFKMRSYEEIALEKFHEWNGMERNKISL